MDIKNFFKNKVGQYAMLTANVLKNNVRQYAMLIALVFVTVLFQILTTGTLLKPQNVANLILQNGYVIILAIGMTLCILTGGNIDLSVGSVVAFIGAMVGIFITKWNMNIYLAIGLALLVGVAVGVWQGFFIAYVRIPAFITTLAGMLLFRGLTNTILQGQTISPFPKEFSDISAGYIRDIVKGSKLNVLTIIVGILIAVIYLLLQFRKRANTKKYKFEVVSMPFFIAKLVVVLAAIGLMTYWLADFKGIPIALIIIGILVVVYSFITSKTVPGRQIYALGGNEKAARLSGIKTKKVMFLVYINMALLAAVAGIMFTSRLNAASPVAGNNFELDAIAACFVGGASATGGVGTITGALIGAFFIGVLNNGMSILGVGSDWQMTIKGLVLLGFVAFDVLSKKK